MEVSFFFRTNTIKTLGIRYASSINMTGARHFIHLLTCRVQSCLKVTSHSGTLSDPFMNGRGERFCGLQIVLKCFQGHGVWGLIIVSPVYLLGHIQVIPLLWVHQHCTTLISSSVGLDINLVSFCRGDKWPGFTHS